MVSLRVGLLVSRSLAAWVPFVLLVGGAAACGPTYTSSDDGGSDDDSGGSDGSDGADGTGGSTDGSGGKDGSGGDSDTGGSDGSGGSDGAGGEAGMCSEDDRCVAAADFDQYCFSPDCAVPVAVSQSEVDRDPCLVPWEERHETIPEECAGADDNMICPDIACEIPPPCASASCNDVTGECEILFCAP
jgi:hypothetical protein